MDGIFKVPSDVPQDLLLIQSFVGVDDPVKQYRDLNVSRPSPIDSSSSSSDSIDSSSSELGSEDEIEDELLLKVEKGTQASDSGSESDSSSSSDELDNGGKRTQHKDMSEIKDEDMDADEEDSGPSAATQSYFRTKNEVTEAIINIPDIEEVGGNERLEKVGEVMNIVDDVVIVKGLPSEIANRGSEKALDTDTLLVFEDRKVLGYIYETFGPTTQPMYQVRFNSTYPLDSEKVRVTRNVFHVPDRSNFVFARRIAAMKGSDASNMNDEEPADHELDFSDDEAEAEFKRNLKKKRAGSRTSSVAAASRQSTPTPSQIRDQDLNDDYTMGRSAFAEFGPYDADYSDVAPSRPAPKPYDDPYSDEFSGLSSTSIPPSGEFPAASTSGTLANETRAGRNRPDQERGSRGRGRGRGRGSRRSTGGHNHLDSQMSLGTRHEVPGNLAYPTQPYQNPQYPQWPPYQANSGMEFHGGTAFQQPFVQPHINPRFASQFGMPFGFGQMQRHDVHSGYTPQFTGSMSQPPSSGQSPTQFQFPWANDWSVHGGAGQTDPSGQNSQQRPQS
uniref:H/ACA ribonucleoprotein complex non-core subunit NAF1 n=1 Tax=Moniliophthora roreri TaxID=221103 RepID=A0A0W0F1S4_MONRR